MSAKSLTRQHADWLWLAEPTGPFLSMPVLLRAFPQGQLPPRDPAQVRALRAAYAAWQASPHAPHAHTVWVWHVLTTVLGYPADQLAEGQSLPPGLEATLPELGETLRPSYALCGPPHPTHARAAQMLIVRYPPTQALDQPIPNQHWKASPATRLMTLLHQANVPLGLATNGEHWLLVYAPRGETTSYANWYAGLWFEEPLTLRAFAALLGLKRFFGVPPAETLLGLLQASTQDQQEVTDQLGDQVREAVEVLVQALDALDRAQTPRPLADVLPGTVYNAALTVMMRLVFLFSAEERGLLLLGQPLYDANYAVSTLQAQLQAVADQHGEEVLERRADAWVRLLATFRAVHGGVAHQDLLLPAYGGSLFDPDRYPFLEGRGRATHWRQAAPVSPLLVNNRVVLHLLNALQRLRVREGGPAETRRVSFRALGVEQIGHVYEGLLDHTARRATAPVLGLRGTRTKMPEIPLETLETMQAQGRPALLEFLQDQTGRSLAALAKALDEGGLAVAPELAHALSVACQQTPALEARVLPWAGLLRADSFGRPLVILPGSVYVTAGTDRRSSGTHYTPPALTQPIVQRTLEPLVYRGPAEGLPRAGWQLRPPAELLRLKICDMAMGSGAFLVQACRYLAERLMEAWEEAERNWGMGNSHWAASSTLPAPQLPITNYQSPSSTLPDSQLPITNYQSPSSTLPAPQLPITNYQSPSSTLPAPQLPITNYQSPSSTLPDSQLPITNYQSPSPQPRITPDGARSSGSPAERLLPTDPAERQAVARRIVADRCLYGVDKNPMAVEMAKLSLWLVTLAKDRPFTFLDHALKCGDSLVGADEDLFLRWAHGVKDAGATLFDAELQNDLTAARAKRRELESFEVRDAHDTARKAALLAEADTALARLKLGCDLLIGTRLLGLKPKEQAKLQNTLLFEYMANIAMHSPDAHRARAAAQTVRAFHWPFEFPEVFEHGGFSAFVGNPPFMGGRNFTAHYGEVYAEGMRGLYPSGTGGADLCAYFFLRSFQNLRPNGAFGLIATNTIAQGDTRTVGLDDIAKHGGTIYSALPSLAWPGVAAVFVSVVHLIKGNYQGEKLLDNKRVSHISSLLDSAQNVLGDPKRLQHNAGKSFQGSTTFGMGFVLDEIEAQRLITKSPKNSDVIFPYINGDDLNSSPSQSPSRWVINFFDWPLEKAALYPDCLERVRNLVKPERDNQNDKYAREYWWRHFRPRPELYTSIATLKRVLVRTRVTKTHGMVFTKTNFTFSDATVVLAYEDGGSFAILQSSFHEFWAWAYGSTLKTDLRYSPTDVFETFPFPQSPIQQIGPISNLQSTGLAQSLETIGEQYHEHRRQIMLARQEGLTKTYNRFHNPQDTSADIAALRRLHVEMDHAVAAAYGWGDPSTLRPFDKLRAQGAGIALDHDFHPTAQGVRYTLSEAARREVLARLLQLNHERWAEEQAAAPPPAPSGKKPRKKKGEEGPRLV